MIRQRGRFPGFGFPLQVEHAAAFLPLPRPIGIRIAHHIYEYFRWLANRAGLPGMRPHDLRHAMASYWIANGVPIKVVSECLGHANIAITLDIYRHCCQTCRPPPKKWTPGLSVRRQRHPHEKKKT